MFEKNLTVEQLTAMKEEAVNRMKMLGLNYRCVQAFKAKEQNVWESCGALGGLYETDEKLRNMIKDVETEHNVVVYHVVESMIYDMKVYSMLCVTPYTDEWEMEREDIKDGYVFCYALNVNQLEFSEFGSIVVRNVASGLVRVG